MEFAKAAKVIFLLDTERSGVSDKWATEFEKMLEVEMTKYSDENYLITFQIFTFGGFIDIFENDFL